MEEISGLGAALDSKADDTDLTNKADAVHTHLWADITDKPTTFTPPAEYITETEGDLRYNLKGEGGATAPTWDEVTGKPTEFPPEAHSHQVSEVTGLQGALDEKLDKTGGTVNGDLIIDGDAIFKNTPTDSGISFLYTAERNILQSSNAPLNGYKPLDLVGSEITVNGVKFGTGMAPNGTVLWTGNLQMTQAQVITPSYPIAKCQNGWLLKWTGSIGQNICYVQCYKFAGLGEWTFNIMADLESWATSQSVTKVIMVNSAGTTITGHNDNTSATNAERYLQAVIAF
jgi:hypothetical protein